jgi:hypothetical protein
VAQSRKIKRVFEEPFINTPYLIGSIISLLPDVILHILHKLSVLDKALDAVRVLFQGLQIVVFDLLAIAGDVLPVSGGEHQSKRQNTLVSELKGQTTSTSLQTAHQRRTYKPAVRRREADKLVLRHLEQNECVRGIDCESTLEVLSRLAYELQAH